MENENKLVVVANPFKGTAKNASKFFAGIDPAFIGNTETINDNPEQKDRFEENLELVKQYYATVPNSEKFITKENEGVVEAYMKHIEALYEIHLAKINTVLKVGDKVYSDFFGHGKIITKQKKTLCFKVRFDDGRYNEFTKDGDYLLNRQTDKAKEMNNRRKIRKV
jgi:hypothetical protein